MKPKINADTLTYLSVTNLAVDIQVLLDQYNTAWMPKKLKIPYEKLLRDAQKLEVIADKLAGYEAVE